MVADPLYGPGTVHPVLMEMERRRALMEAAGLRKDVFASLDWKCPNHPRWPIVLLRSRQGRDDAPMHRGQLVGMTEKEFRIHALGEFWAARRSHWDLVEVNGDGRIQP